MNAMRLVWIALLLMKGVDTLLRAPSVSLHSRDRVRLKIKSEPIDPLDYVNGGGSGGARGGYGGDGTDSIRNIRGSTAQTNGNEETGRLNEEEEEVDEAYVQEFLQTIEADMLQGLPTEMMESFQSYLVQLLPRVSLFSLVVHLMLLIPTLRYVKLELHQSIYPYLYLGPFMLLLPFAVFYFGESKLYEQPFMFGKLEAYLRVQKHLATEYLRDEEERIVTVLDELLREKKPDEKATEKVVRNIALARLLSRADVEFLAREVLAAKRARLGLYQEAQDDAALSLVASSAAIVSPRMSSLSRASSPLQGAGLNSGTVSPFFSITDSEEQRGAGAGTGAGSPISAAFRLIEGLRKTEEGRVRSDAEILGELRSLQSQLERAEEA